MSKKHYQNSKKKAFTLAEILITIGIIGVVAALTIPAVMTDNRKKITTTRLKHFYSMMKQTVRMSEYENGPVGGWDFEKEERDENNKMIVSDRIAKGNTFAQKYILPYTKAVSIEEFPLWKYLSDASVPLILLPDGSCMSIFNGGAKATDVYYDVNCKEKPNELGRDQFNFVIYKEGSAGFDTYWNSYETGKTTITQAERDTMKSYCAKKTIAFYCSTLLKLDNWEFKKDYPHKI